MALIDTQGYSGSTCRTAPDTPLVGTTVWNVTDSVVNSPKVYSMNIPNDSAIQITTIYTNVSTLTTSLVAETLYVSGILRSNL